MQSYFSYHFHSNASRRAFILTCRKSYNSSWHTGVGTEDYLLLVGGGGGGGGWDKASAPPPPHNNR